MPCAMVHSAGADGHVSTPLSIDLLAIPLTTAAAKSRDPHSCSIRWNLTVSLQT